MRPTLRSKIPKYVQTAEVMKERITSGQWSTGSKLPRVADLQQLFGVSLGTMDKVLTSLENEGLIERSQGSGIYVTHQHRRVAKRRAQTGIIGFYGFGTSREQPYGMHFYGQHLLDGAKKAADRSGHNLLLLNDAPGDAAWQNLDGLLSWTVAENDVIARRPDSLPWVSLDYELNGVVSVTPDEYSGSYQATSHLLRLGHRKIAYLIAGGGRLQNQRLRGYQDALQEAGVEPLLRWVRHLQAQFDEETGFVGAAASRMNEWLNDDWTTLGCTALLAHNDQTGIGVIEALISHGLRVPDDVSVIGYDGTQAVEMVRPRLSTVEVPLEEIGRRGVESLLKMMNGEEISSQVLPVQLKVRESCAPPLN